MKKPIFFLSVLLVIASLGCSKSEDADVNNPNLPGPDAGIPDDPERVDYVLSTSNGSGVTGLASFIPNDDGSTTIYIDLENASQGIHPATVNFGTLESGGAIAITLNECECEISETVVTQLDNGTPVTFVELMTFDGHLNIYESPTDGTTIAQTNIGANSF
ncbi:hypothetical protein [Robiginitalea marina]|uniref:CHRD domain-containing protein n=1 Tax=Robiginitalea marina TaxID=2954105 RepID=A0ABT1AUU1_9FLAO|nr:hypothetical protein [Robiginitalea marina]MCO5723337.1 hypothetical protein [Robiginitalea marina]